MRRANKSIGVRPRLRKCIAGNTPVRAAEIRCATRNAAPSNLRLLSQASRLSRSIDREHTPQLSSAEGHDGNGVFIHGLGSDRLQTSGPEHRNCSRRMQELDECVGGIWLFRARADAGAEGGVILYLL